MIDFHLQNFLTAKVNPAPETVSQASESQNRLREIMAGKLIADSSLPTPLEGHDFLTGSALRGTKNVPFDDIDLMLVLDGSMLVPIIAGQVVGTTYGSGKSFNPVLAPDYLDANGYVSSQKILNKLRAVLGETYTRSEIRKDGQAINVWMDSYSFGIDVVPAFKVATPANGLHYYIPLGTGSDMWQPTNPHADLQVFETEDARLNGLLRPTARLMRKWNELSNGGRLSGFHVDALVLRSLEGKVVESLELAVLTCLVSFEALLGTSSPQFSGFTPHIDHKLSEEDRRLSIVAVKRTSAKIFSAISRKVPHEITAAWNAGFADQLF
jgi:hypothetical protein